MKVLLIVSWILFGITLAQNWGFYTNVYISGSSGDLNNTVVPFTFNSQLEVSQGRMKSDGSDIRFSETLSQIDDFPYSIVSGMNTAQTVVLVKVPFLRANTVTTIVMLSGNPLATASNKTLNRLLVSAGTIQTVTSSVQYDIITVENTATLRIDSSSGLVKLSAAVINVVGLIDGVALGTRGRLSGGDGPGTGNYTFVSGASGAGYGGVGGNGGYDSGEPRSIGGQPYGSNNGKTIQVGSPGAGSNVETGGNGGTGVWIEGSMITITGKVDASGGAGRPDSGQCSGGGSGGGILIIGRSVNLFGSLIANGGNGGSSVVSQGDGGGGGGGGRIKVFYQTLSSNTTVSVTGGTGGCCGGFDFASAGTAGTYYTEQGAVDLPLAVFNSSLVCRPNTTCQEVGIQCGFYQSNCGPTFCGYCQTSGYGCSTLGQCVSTNSTVASVVIFSSATIPAQESTTIPEDIRSSKGSNQILPIAVGAGVGGFVLIVLIVVVAVVVTFRLARKTGSHDIELDLQRQNSSRMDSAPPSAPHSASPSADKLPSTSYVSMNLSTTTKPAPAQSQANRKSQLLANNWEIDYNEIEFSNELGRGAYGIVYLATWRMQWVAVKKLREESFTKTQMDNFKTEAELYMALRPHKNVVVFLGVCTKPLCIVTEYLGMGSVEHFIKTDVKIDLNTAVKMATDIAAGMAHLHAEGVIHRDLACRNLLLDDQMNIKITDFGMSRVVSESTESYTNSDVGPLKWMSPESIVSKEYSTKSDVFMFGVCVIEILTRNEPWPGQTPMDVALTVVRDGKRHPIPDYCPHELGVLLESCWVTTPSERPDFKSIYSSLYSIQLSLRS